ncbi:recombinase family protein [Peribacillus sp. NPDC097077]
MRRGIQYSRKSTNPRDFLDEKEGIKYQEQVMDEYCIKHNIEIIARYSDVGYSGVHTQRPELLEMLDFLKKSEEKIDVLLFFSVDRLGRDLRNNINLALKISGFVNKIVFVSEGITNNYEHFKLFLILKSIVAEEERINIITRLAGGRRTKVMNRKIYSGNKAPLGYVQKKDGSLKLASLDETKDLTDIIGLEAVNYIFLAYLSNQSLSQIAKDLRRKFGLTRMGKVWDKNSVAYILRNDIYAGILSGKISGEEYTIPSGNIEPLLSMVTYQFVKTKISNSVKGRKPKKNTLPQLSICIQCLKPVVLIGEEISCPSCRKSINAELLSKSIKKKLVEHLFGNYTSDIVNRYLMNERTNLFFRIQNLKEKVKDLEGTQLLIESMFKDDPKELKLLLSYNKDEIRNLEREIREINHFLEFLYGEKAIDLNEEDVLIKGRNDLSLDLPHLLLIDFNLRDVYIKFHPCVFEGKTKR